MSLAAAGLLGRVGLVALWNFRLRAVVRSRTRELETKNAIRAEKVAQYHLMSMFGARH